MTTTSGEPEYELGEFSVAPIGAGNDTSLFTLLRESRSSLPMKADPRDIFEEYG
jgi:hypothetical protein